MIEFEEQYKILVNIVNEKNEEIKKLEATIYEQNMKSLSLKTQIKYLADKIAVVNTDIINSLKILEGQWDQY